MTPEQEVEYVWTKLETFRYLPELVGAGWSLRIVGLAVKDIAAYTKAWDEKSLQVLRQKKQVAI